MDQYALYQLGEGLNRALPPGACRWLAERIGEWQWRCSAPDRAAVQANLSLIHGRPIGPWSGEVREVFRNFGRYLLEFTNADRVAPADVTINASPPVDELLRSGRGALLLSAHVGNWELGAVALAKRGHRVAAVALPHADLRVNRWFDRRRSGAGVEVIPLGSRATRRCLELLRAGYLIGIVGDREFGLNGLDVTFFGRQAMVPRGPALLSLRSGAPAVPTFMIRESFGRFTLQMEPPLWPPERASAEAVDRLTRQYTAVIERAIRRFPEQWLMFRVVGAERPSDVRQPDSAVSRGAAGPGAA